MNGKGVQRVSLCPLSSAQYACLQGHFMPSDPGSFLSACVTTPCLCDLVCVKVSASLCLSVTASGHRILCALWPSWYESQGVTCGGCLCLSVCICLCVAWSGLFNYFCVWACSCLSLCLCH